VLYQGTYNNIPFFSGIYAATYITSVICIRLYISLLPLNSVRSSAPCV